MATLLFGAIAAGGCGSGGSSSGGIPCSGPEHCSSYGLVCHNTLLVCVACNTAADCVNGGACVNNACQAGVGGSVSSGGQGGSGLVGNAGGASGSVSTGGVSGSVSTGGVSGSVSSGGVSGSVSSGGASGSVGSGGASGSGGSEPICDSTTPDGLSDCCPDAVYPWWCWHGYTGYGNCFAYGVDCATVTVCSPETFARACPAGDFVACETCIAGNYGHCYYTEPCF